MIKSVRGLKKKPSEEAGGGSVLLSMTLVRQIGDIVRGGTPAFVRWGFVS